MSEEGGGTVSDGMDGKTILVTAVTGSQGSAAARHLLKTGWRVRGLTRNTKGKRAQALAGTGVELCGGNMGDRADLERAIGGAYGVYAVTDFLRNGVEAEVLHGKLIADVCKSAGVKHLVFASVASADRQTGVPHFESKWQIEQYIEQLGLPATILRPTIFMEDLTDMRYFPIVGWGMMPKIIGARQPVDWIAVDDIGAVTAVVFAKPEAFAGQRVALTGDTQSIAGARSIFKRVNGRVPFGLPMPAGLFGRMVSKDLLTMWYWLSRNTFDTDVEALRKIHPNVMSMEIWLKGKRSRSDKPA
jgi:uncharacterized protein YbjT (DUF2867 family)